MAEVELPNPDLKEMLLAQQQSSDQWAFYQAKVIREHLYRAQRLNLELALAEPGALQGPARAKFEALAQKFAEEEKRYNAEKKDIEKDAKKLETERDRHQRRDPYFDFAEVFLFSLVLAVAGAGLAANGFLQLFTLPFLHH